MFGNVDVYTAWILKTPQAVANVDVNVGALVVISTPEQIVKSYWASPDVINCVYPGLVTVAEITGIGSTVKTKVIASPTTSTPRS